MQECSYSKCDDATAAILGSLTGNNGLFGCDMMEILYAGDVQGGYYQGWRDQVAAKSAYLLALANMGVIVQSAYMTKYENDSDSAWKVVQNHYDK
jgi:hypothetical protein